MKEVWKDIKNFKGYQVSNFGNIRSVDRESIQWNGHKNIKVLYKGKMLKKQTTKGYLTAVLWKDKKMYNKKIHRLVAEAFISNPNEYPIVNHIDGNKKNNNVANLEWCTYSHNVSEAYKLGLMAISDKHKEKARQVGLSTGKAVMQIDLNGNVVNIFCSGRQASLLLGISQGNISSCCSGRMKTYKGYKWKYV